MTATRPAGWTTTAINPALQAALDSADTARAALRDTRLKLQRADDANADLRRRLNGAIYLVRNADPTAGTGHTAVLLADLLLILESSRDTTPTLPDTSPNGTT